MARSTKLTDAKIRDLDPQDKDYFTPVDGLPLRVRVSRKGTKSFVVKFYIYPKLPPNEEAVLTPQPRPKQVECVLGNFPSMSLETAKELAQQLIKAGKQGIDQRLVWKREEAELARKMKAIQLEYLDFADPDDPTYLKTAWNNYAANKVGISHRHALNLKRLWKHLSHLPETTRTGDLKPSDIGKIRKTLAGTPQEFNKFRMVLFGVLETELHDGRISQNVLRKKIDSVRPFTLKYRDTILTENGVRQFIQFFSQVETFPERQQNHARFLLALLYTGQRPSMLRSLLKEDDGEGNFVDFETGLMHFRRHKTASKSTERAPTVRASKKALDIMRTACVATPYSPYVFGSHDARKHFRDLPLSERRSQEFFRKHAHLFEKEGTEKLEIYSLRHTFGTRMVESGIPIHQLKDIMLHTSILTTQRYVRSTEAARKVLAERIDEIMG